MRDLLAGDGSFGPSQLGRRNWYLPKWLGWLPHAEVEGPHNRPVTIPVPVSSR